MVCVADHNTANSAHCLLCLGRCSWHDRSALVLGVHRASTSYQQKLLLSRLKPRLWKATQIKQHAKLQDANRQEKTTNKVKNDECERMMIVLP
jgi:hypothetical protein